MSTVLDDQNLYWYIVLVFYIHLLISMGFKYLLYSYFIHNILMYCTVGPYLDANKDMPRCQHEQNPFVR